MKINEVSGARIRKFYTSVFIDRKTKKVGTLYMILARYQNAYQTWVITRNAFVEAMDYNNQSW